MISSGSLITKDSKVGLYDHVQVNILPADEFELIMRGPASISRMSLSSSSPIFRKLTKADFASHIYGH